MDFRDERVRAGDLGGKVTAFGLLDHGVVDVYL